MLTGPLQDGGRSVFDREHPLEMRRHSPVSSIVVLEPEDDPPEDLDYQSEHEQHFHNHALSYDLKNDTLRSSRIYPTTTDYITFIRYENTPKT